MSSVLDSAEYLMLIFQKMLSGPRWWAPKGRGPWCTAPLAPPVWPPLMSLHLNHKPDSASRGLSKNS